MAGVMRRLAAMLYDSLLVFGVLFAATLPALFLGGNGDAAIENEQVVHELPVVGGWPFQLYLLTVFIAFFCWFWRRDGQTLGMQAWRLKVEDMAGNRISIVQCLQRLAGATVSLGCGGIGYWWIWIDKDGMSWHDRWSKTRVVVLPKANTGSKAKSAPSANSASEAKSTPKAKSARKTKPASKAK